jgi:aspartyl-tRNA(Asn)/glutamyl-tRNA(Gln) amidotransferase subunit A
MLKTDKVTWGDYEEDILLTLSRFTGPFNVSGLPAVSVPVGFDEKGLSIGLQIAGKMYSENKLISAGNWIMNRIP